MNGKLAAGLLAGLLALGLLWQGERSIRRLSASRALAQAEVDLLAAARSGRAPVPVFAANLASLQTAAQSDPLEVGIPLTLGSYQLLLRNPQVALFSYQVALALEPRPEIYLNIGRALRAQGRLDEAQQYRDLALRLNPYLDPGYTPK